MSVKLHVRWNLPPDPTFDNRRNTRPIFRRTAILPSVKVHLLLPLALIALGAQPLPAQDAPDSAPPTKAERDRLTQLQIFLDNANFGPGKIDGRWGEFTRKSLTRYLRANGEDAPEFTETAPDPFPVDVASINPIYTTYEIQQSDLDSLGSVPSEPAEQAEQDAMPYVTLTELVAEKFHVDREYLATLNEGTSIDDAKAGDTLTVPNVAQPFSLADVQKRADEAKAEAEEEEKSEDSDPADDTPSPTPAETKSIVITTSEKMLDLYEDDKLVASFPITPGSDSLPAPVGEWKIDGDRADAVVSLR